MTSKYSPSKQIRFRKWLKDFFGYAAIIGICVLIIFPFLWMVTASFMPKEEIQRYPPRIWPERWTLGNYKSLFIYQGLEKKGVQALKEQGIDTTDIYPTDEAGRNALKNSSVWKDIGNSIFIVVMASLGTVVISGPAGYAFAKIKVPGREIIFIFVLSSMMIPWMTILLPRYVMFRDLGWVPGPLPLFIPELLTGTALATFFYRQHFLAIPDELVEAAKVDGASHWNIYWKIMFPLSKSVAFTVIMFTMLFKWNELIGPLVYLHRPEEFTVTLMVYQLIKRTSLGVDPTAAGLRMAGALITTIPVLLFYFFAQQHFIAGLTQGAVKE